MQILKRGDFDALIEKSANATSRSVRRRQRRDARNVIANRGAANGFFVVEGFAAKRRVNDQIDFASFDKVHDIGTPFIYFVDRLRWNAGSFEGRGGAARRQQTETQIVQLFSERAEVTLVAVIHAEKNRALTRQARAGRE